MDYIKGVMNTLQKVAEQKDPIAEQKEDKKKEEKAKKVDAIKRFLEDTDHVEDEVIQFKAAKKQRS